MAPDYSVNTKGLALKLTWKFLIAYILPFACVILFVIPFKIHFAHILWNLCQLHIFTGRQVIIWQIFRKHENIPDDIYGLHLHIEDFKTNIEKEFNFLKEATCKNVENFQTLLNLQQTYSVALCSHVNNIYHKILEIQRQLPHSIQHMNTGDVIQIDAPDFDPGVDEGLPTQEHKEAQGSASITQQSFKKSDKCEAPALLQLDVEEVDWLDAIPVEIPPQPDQNIEQNIPVLPTRRETNHNEIPQLESDLDEEEGQFEDLQTYLTHHNTYQESQNICKEYRKRLLDLDDNRYYREIDHVFETYGPTQDHITANQAPGPHHMRRSLYKHLADEEVRHAGRSSMGTDPLEHEHNLCRAESNERSRKLNACDRGM